MTAATTRLGAGATRASGWWYAAVGLTGAGVIITLGNLHVAKGEQGGLGPAVGTAVLCVLLAAALFGLGLPRWSGGARATIVLGVLAVLSLVVFWSGLVAVLATATVAVAPRGATAGRGVRIMVVLAAVSALLAGGWTLVSFLT